MSNIDYKINDQRVLKDAINLSLKILNPSEKEIEEYHSENDWINKIKQDGLIIVVYVDSKPAGFVVCYVKEQDALHIWVGGVLEEFRGLGLWTGMYNKIEEYAKSKKLHRLTLNTYQDKFPVMYKFAFNNNFTRYKTETKDDFDKSYFEKRIAY